MHATRKKKIGAANILSDDYVIIKSIGSGSFGEVFLAQNKKGTMVAAKVEDKNKQQRVENEYKIYRDLHKNNFKTGIPKIYEFLQTRDYNIMIMQLLGPSLEEMFVNHGRLFQLNTVFYIAMEIIALLEQLHDAGYIHRDIKPNNFLIGRDKYANQLFILDFGLSKKYIVNGEHIGLRNGRSLIGTARYASINMHYGFEPSRRDDLISTGYMLIYFLKGILPWQGIKKKKGCNNLENIGEIKISTNNSTLCSKLPSCFQKYLEYCCDLDFDADPDYDYLKQLFIDDAELLNIKPKFEWSNQSSSKHCTKCFTSHTLTS